MSEYGEECHDASERLAAALGLDTGSFVEVLGSGWHALPQADGEQDQDAAWWAAGEPIQLLLHHGRQQEAVRVAVPNGVWRGHRLVYVPGRTENVSLRDAPDEIRSTVGQLLKARRSSFRYCRFCRSLTPPEYRHEPDVCMGCSERWLGVTH